MVDWNAVDTVFLDMDGTLLDLHFDNYILARAYTPVLRCSMEGIPDRGARRAPGALPGLRGYIGLVLRGALEPRAGPGHRVPQMGARSPHRHASPGDRFSGSADLTGQAVGIGHQRLPEALTLKLEKTPLAVHFERIICSHDLGTPKEADDFWPRGVQTIEPFDRQRTLLIDDSPKVLEAAWNYGFRQLLAVLAPDSHQAPVRKPYGFPAVRYCGTCCPTWGPDASQPLAI